MRAIGYIRVSTEDQASNGISLETQEQKIRQYCALNDLELVEMVEDRGVSAKNVGGRPGFKRALAMVATDGADALVVFKLDRAFRSTRDALEVAEKLNKRSKALHSITEKLDTTSAVGEFFFTLLASLAQMERKLIGERTKAALDLKASKGEKLGGSAPYGVQLSNDGVHLEMNQSEQQVIREMIKLHHGGYSSREIAETLNDRGRLTRKGTLWSHTLVQRVLRRHKEAA